jgi:hypothetical protein
VEKPNYNHATGRFRTRDSSTPVITIGAVLRDGKLTAVQPPPQSVSDSDPFATPSEQVGTAQASPQPPAPA